MAEVKITRLLPPSDWVDKQLGTLKAVGRQNYEKRIAIPKKSPIAAGIAAEDRYADEMRKVLEEKYSLGEKISAPTSCTLIAIHLPCKICDLPGIMQGGVAS